MVNFNKRVYRCSNYKVAKSFSLLLFSLSYGFFLSLIPNTDFKDFSNYLVYADHSWSILLSYSNKGFLSLISNEPIWLLVNVFFSLFFEGETVVRVIIFFSASSVAWLTLSNNPRHIGWLILFLFLPWVIKNNLIHLRQGLAISIFLWGWFSSNRPIRVFFIAISPFVHASFFFVLFILGLSKFLRVLRLGPVLRILSVSILGFIIGFGLKWLVSLLGARQAEEYNFSMTDVSGAAFVFWSLILLIMVLEGRSFLRKHSFEVGVVLFYLSTYWLIEVTGRIFESSILLVLISGLMLSKWRKYLFCSAIMIFGLSLWLIRIGQPLFGFGIG